MTGYDPDAILPLLAAAVNVADRVIDVIPRGKSDQWWEATR